MTARLYLTDDLYVELPHDHTVVSWPGGHKVLDTDATLPDLLAALRVALQDIMAERCTPREFARAKQRVYNAGYQAGHEAAQPRDPWLPESA